VEDLQHPRELIPNVEKLKFTFVFALQPVISVESSLVTVNKACHQVQQSLLTVLR
jgi:hypothetical protein